MPGIANVQQNAKLLVGRLINYYAKPRGCFGFFSNITHMVNQSALDDAHTLTLMSQRLEHNPTELLLYIQETAQGNQFTQDDFPPYKDKILLGMYLVLWVQYESSVSYYLNGPLIQLFQKHLGLSTPKDMDQTLFSDSLNALSVYCSFVYNHRTEPGFKELDQRLGPSIQVTIDATRSSRNPNNSSFSCISGLLCSLGLDNAP